MTPVISPWVFYLMPVCGNIVTISWVLFILGLICLGICGLIWLFATVDCDDEIADYLFAVIKKLFVVVLVTCLLICVIPREETVIKMLIAQNVTYERVDMVSSAISDTVTNVYNDIMNLFRDSGAANG